jgi:SAM-dependent methyltransferase
VNEIVPNSAEAVVSKVRERYGRIATGEIAGCGCGCGPADAEAVIAQGVGYRTNELAELPEEANLGLGCGAPIAPLAPQPGETVVDLGSGAGIDAFLAARQVGPTGRVIGVDMTPAMLERARGAAERNGFTNVEFREGRLEALPIADASVDAVTSNCVFNLVPDKAAVFREVARVLKPGGRLVVSDIVLDRPLPGPLATDLLAWVGCVAGAELRPVYFAKLAEAGLTELEIVKDIDYARTLIDTAPDEAQALLGRFGLKPEDVAGAVRSITYRARRPAEAKSCCGPDCCPAA